MVKEAIAVVIRAVIGLPLSYKLYWLQFCNICLENTTIYACESICTCLTQSLQLEVCFLTLIREASVIALNTRTKK